MIIEQWDLFTIAVAALSSDISDIMVQRITKVSTVPENALEVHGG